MDVKDLLPVIEEVKTATSGRMETIETKQTELQAIVNDLAQKSLRGTGRESQLESKDAVAEAIKSAPDFQRFQKGLIRNTRIELPVGALQVKAVTASSATIGVGINTQPGITPPPQRRFFLRDLIPSIPVSQGIVQYLQEASFTNSAAVALENTLKPQSDLATNLVQAPIATIAHWIRATKQILDDAPALQAYIDTRLRYGLALAEDAQILTGSGTGGNLHGLLPQAQSLSGSVAGDTHIDTLRRAIGQLATLNYNADAIVLNPLDWEAIELTKDTQNRYIIFGTPSGAAEPRLWGTPVVVTNAIAAGTWLVGDVALGAQIFDRQQPIVEISTEDQDNFVKNLVTIRGEERIGLAVKQTQAFVTGTFS